MYLIRRLGSLHKSQHWG